jgi:hypothetical protein
LIQAIGVGVVGIATVSWFWRNFHNNESYRHFNRN